MTHLDSGRPISSELARLLLVWLVLVVLGGVEVAVSLLDLPRFWRPCVVLLPAVLMVATVAVGFMEVRRGPVLVRAFAVAGVFWLLILLGLGSTDPLTRTDYPVPGRR